MVTDREIRDANGAKYVDKSCRGRGVRSLLYSFAVLFGIEQFLSAKRKEMHAARLASRLSIFIEICRLMPICSSIAVALYYIQVKSRVNLVDKFCNRALSVIFLTR